MSESDKMLERCIECGLCVKECDFLQMHCESPRDLAESFKAGKHRTSPEIPYSCNLCGLCEVRCPEGLNVGRMCFEVRHQLVQEGLAPLKPHQPLRDAQDWYVSDAFRLALPSPESLKSSDASGSGKTIRAFFPGCALSAYSPDLVINAYEYLLQKLPGTGIVLGCCGAPAYLIGGASEIIVACPCCYLVLKQYLPHLNPISLYTVLVRIGLPEAKPAAGAREKRTFSIHDPCSSRLKVKFITASES